MNFQKWILSFAAAMLMLAGCGLLDPDQPGNLVPETVMEDSSLPSLTLNGTTFHLETFGDTGVPTLIFLHGGPGFDYKCLTRLTDLSSDYFLVMFDQRGTGLSERHDADEISVDIYAQDLDVIIDYFSVANSGQPVVLVGHSWGGQYAVLYTARHPAKVDKLILIEPGPVNGEDYLRYFSENYSRPLSTPWINDWVWLEDIISPDTHARLDYQEALGAFNFEAGYNESETDKMPFRRLGKVAKLTLKSEGITATGVDYDFTDGLEQYTAPVLFIRGSLNETMTDEYMHHFSDDFFAQLTAAQKPYLTIDDAGHDLVWIKAAEVMAAIDDFLRNY